MRLQRAAAGVALAALCVFGALSCSKSPTSASGQSISVAVAVTNTAALPTLTAVTVLLDGQSFIVNTSATALSTFTLSGTTPLASGAHTLAVQITGQSITPQTYTVTPDVEVFDVNGNLVNNVVPTAQTLSLATGAAVTFNFTI